VQSQDDTHNEACGLHHRAMILPRREPPVLWPILAEVNAQPLQQNGRQSDIARNSTLSLADMQYHALAVDIVHPEMLQLSVS
jgi:hypothetical protein